MTAEEIRRESLDEFEHTDRAIAYFLREIAAQLAELNERLASGSLTKAERIEAEIIEAVEQAKAAISRE